MSDFRALLLEDFKVLGLAEQRRYLRECAEHLEAATRIHTELAHPHAVPRTSPESGGQS